MISRRNLLTGLSLLPLAGGVMGCAARATGVAASQTLGGPIPVVGPGARWNGTPLTGGTPPTDPVRTTAKPAVQWWQPSENRLTGDMVIGVDADALGGVAHVDFWVEGNVQRVTQTLYADTDVNGNARKRVGYWITLNSGAFKAVSINGSARIFATATPNDGTMQARTIGFDATHPGSVNGTNSDRKMIIYPRAIDHDFVANVGAGQTYTTLDAAIAALKAANAESAQLTLTDSAFYELTTAATALYAGAKGFHVINAAPGVNAIIGRRSFPTGGSSTFKIDPQIECLEFQGAGITIDFRNFTTLGNSGYVRGYRFNGCKVTNSIGTRDTLYWNKGVIQGQQGNPVPGYVQDCTITYVTNFMVFQIMATGNKVHMVEGHTWSATPFAANNYVHSQTAGFFRNVILAMDIAYTGAGTATLSKTGGSDSGSLVLTAIGGGSSKTYLLGQTTADPWFNISAIVNDINANVAGWTATLRDDTRRASALLGHGFGSTNGFSNQPVTSAGVSLDTWFDHHCDVVQFRTDDSFGIRENCIYRGLTMVGIADGGFSNPGTNTLRMDSNLHDIVITDCAFGNPDGSASTAISQATNASTYSHVYLRNVAHEAGTVLSAATCDRYCVYEQCVIGQIGWATSSGPTPFTFKDCYIAYGFQGATAFTASPNSGNTLFNALHQTDFNLNTLVTSAATGSFLPLSGMPTKPSISPYDALNNRRAATDAIGPVSRNQVSAPVWPF